MTQHTRWVTAEVLRALAEHGPVRVVLASDIDAWTRRTLTHEQRVHATSRLCALGFLKHKMRVAEGRRVDLYHLTDDGLAAVQAAGAGQVRKSGPKAPHGKAHALPPGSISARLWALLRVRGHIDSDAAARLLGDAGKTDTARLQDTVRRTLKRWAAAGAVAEAARRVAAPGQSKHSNGCKRYVLVADSVAPPRWHGAGGAA